MRINSIRLFGRVFLLAAAILFLCLPVYKAEASAGIKIYDYTTKKSSVYNGVIPKVTLNQAVIGDGTTQGILVNGIALLSYSDIFEKSAIQAECIYNKNKGTVSISKYGITIVMTIGSKRAAVNGKQAILPVAPMKIKYAAAGLTKVMVPSRFVAETLGLGYTWYSDRSTIEIEKNTILLSYNGTEKSEYSGIQGKVTVDGRNVSLTGMPSIIKDNTAMLRTKRVFADSAIDADYSYSSSNKTITLVKGENTLVMTVGSKTAYVNGKKVSLNTAPLVVKNYETGSSYVMVPGQFTATSLGYDYLWNKFAETSVITTRMNSLPSDSSDNSNTEPELGDNGVYNEPGNILNEWKAAAATYVADTGVHETDSGIVYDQTAGYVYYASRDYSVMKSNSETYMLTATMPFGKVTSSTSGNLISISIPHFNCSDQTFQLYGITGNLVNTLGTYNNPEMTGSTIELEIMPGSYGYDLSLSADKLTLYVTVYKNCLKSAAVGVNDEGDYLTLEGIKPLGVSITNQVDYLSLDIPEAMNSLGEINADITGSKFIKKLYIYSSVDKTQILLFMNPGYEYYLIENGNQYTLSFRAGGETKEEPETPIVDKSGYEIIIPKPPEVKKSMISDEDYYFKNYFVIRLKGDYTQFYQNNNIAGNSGDINHISVSLNGDGDTEIKIATSKLQGYEIASDQEAICVHIGDPRDIYKNIVVLDPGHGGDANGAQYFGTKEKDLNLKVLYTLGKKYFNSDTSKLKVYYTRTSDVDMPLSERAAFVKKVGADLFVSLHMNAAEAAPGVHGSEVFYSVNNNKPNSAGLKSQQLATLLNTNLYTTLGTTNRGVKTENYTVIYKNTVPAVLIELGFLSNKEDHALLTKEEFQDKTAKTIYDTLLQVFKEYPTGR